MRVLTPSERDQLQRESAEWQDRAQCRALVIAALVAERRGWKKRIALLEKPTWRAS